VRPIDFPAIKKEHIYTIACIISMMGADICISNKLQSLGGGMVEGERRFYSDEKIIDSEFYKAWGGERYTWGSINPTFKYTGQRHAEPPKCGTQRHIP
jgi:hypothetical protein